MQMHVERQQRKRQKMSASSNSSQGSEHASETASAIAAAVNEPKQEDSSCGWACFRCTFVNVAGAGRCSICEADSPVAASVQSAPNSDAARDEAPDAAAHSTSAPGTPPRATDSNNTIHDIVAATAPVAVPAHTRVRGPDQLVVLTFNVWFNEQVQLEARMRAIGDIILRERPGVVCLQEVTSNIYMLLRLSMWWPRYHCSAPSEPPTADYFVLLFVAREAMPATQGSGVAGTGYAPGRVHFRRSPFPGSTMGRELLTAEATVLFPASGSSRPMALATVHLESPLPWVPSLGVPQWGAGERRSQLQQSLHQLDVLCASELDGSDQEQRIAVLAGDMNWTERRGAGSSASASAAPVNIRDGDGKQGDGDVPLTASGRWRWADAWIEMQRLVGDEGNDGAALAPRVLFSAHQLSRAPKGSQEQPIDVDGDEDEDATSARRTVAASYRLPGYTYDAVRNGMLTGRLQGRFDRCFFRAPSQGSSMHAAEARLVGTEPILHPVTRAAVTYSKEGRKRKDGSCNVSTLPVYPSDHFGLLTTFRLH